VGRRKRGQKKGEVYTTRARTDTPTDEITKMYKNKIDSLGNDITAQNEITFKLWDVLRGAQDKNDDVLKTAMICTPDTVPEFIKQDIAIDGTTREQWTIECKWCGWLLTYMEDSGHYACESCGVVAEEKLTMETNMHCFSVVRTHDIVKKHVYDRMSHFRALMSSIQGISQTKLCDKMLATLRTEADAEGVVVSPKWVMERLKAHKMGKYTPKRFRIAQLLDHTCLPPVLELGEMERLMSSFALVCKHFDEWRTDETTTTARKNFMSYPYIAHQLFKMIGMPKMCASLLMISSPARMKVQNGIWAEVCERTGWAFNPIIIKKP